MKCWWSITRNNWDRLAKDICFILFGGLSLIHPLAAESSTTSRVFAILFNLELIIAGLLLLISVYTDSYLCRLIGYTVYSLGMFTIAGLILIGPGSSVWILMVGWGLQGVMSARLINRDSRLAQQLSEMYRQLAERRDHGT